MVAVNEDRLRALIRLMPPARSLKEDLEKSLHMEHYGGTGDLALRSYRALQEAIARLTEDPYVSALSVEPAGGADDREKVSLVLLAVGQLLAYLEGQTGLPATQSTGPGKIQVRSPNINFTNVEGVSREALDHVLNMAADLGEGSSAKSE